MLILASASPRRHELLLNAGIPHFVQPTSVPEIRLLGEPPEQFVQRLAEQKAAPIRSGRSDVVLAADTVVCVDNQVLGKPADPADAARMLGLLSGRSHWVHTGICLRSAERSVVDLASTEVWFTSLTQAEIKGYTRSGESWDKAGAYAIQGRASRFVQKINGCYHNVVGLPISMVYAHLLSMGWSDPDAP